MYSSDIGTYFVFQVVEVHELIPQTLQRWKKRSPLLYDIACEHVSMQSAVGFQPH